MTVHSETVQTERTRAIGIIVVDNPPVNAIAPSVRDGIHAAAIELARDPDVKAVVLHCANGTFMAGADIRKLNAPPSKLTSAELIGSLEGMDKPVVAALEGNALGGGLEFAMGFHFRCATPGTNLGLPEVNLGLIPGAAGTQRLPRLVGVAKALDMIVSGKPVAAAEALEAGLVDRVIAGRDPRAEAIAYAEELVAEGRAPRRTRAIETPAADDSVFAEAERLAARTRRGEVAPQRAIQSVRNAVDCTFDEGVQREKALFEELRNSAQSRALRHLFMAERQISRIPGIDKSVAVRKLERVGVVGAGTMGRGIAMACANAGLAVTLVEMDAEALEHGLAAIRSTYEASVAKRRMTGNEMDARIDLICGTVDRNDLREADLVVEAVFEEMQIKKDLFAGLDRICRPGAVLATNTSALDIDVIAAATARPQDVVGLHFFSPAHVMRLVEIVKGRQTAADVIATSINFAKRLRKLGVLAGNCDGFIGNRMLAGYRRESEFLLLEGASPEQVDHALTGFGMSMGPHTMGDMAGLDVGAAGRRRRRLEGSLPDDPRFGIVADRLVEAGHFGQKTGSGYYRYEPGRREPLPDAFVTEIIEREAARLGVARRTITDEEIIERCMLPLINEGARILEERIAQRPGDIDVIYVNGYGFPRYRGGPMQYADEIGLDHVLARTRDLRASQGDLYWVPAPLLERLVAEGRRFADLN
jgi:3-hydroxyacyl-CoA dehydrogenase